MVVLMFLVNYLRFYMTKLLNAQSNPLLEPASISHRTLRGTMLEHKCDSAKERSSDEVDLNKVFDKIKGDFKHGSAVARS
jgi:hypothetical protein